MIVVLISGKQGSGKSTLAKALSEKYSNIAYRLRFAQPLYEMHDAVRSILAEYEYQPYNYNIKDGNLLQLLGTEWGRKMNQQIWVQLLVNKIRKLPKASLVLIEDCRFENEFDAFMNIESCIKVRLEASRQTRKMRAEMWRTAEDHPSEVGLDHYAAMGKFDLLLDADKLSPSEILDIVARAAEQELMRLK